MCVFVFCRASEKDTRGGKDQPILSLLRRRSRTMRTSLSKTCSDRRDSLHRQSSLLRLSCCLHAAAAAAVGVVLQTLDHMCWFPQHRRWFKWFQLLSRLMHTKRFLLLMVVLGDVVVVGHRHGDVMLLLLLFPIVTELQLG